MLRQLCLARAYRIQMCCLSLEGVLPALAGPPYNASACTPTLSGAKATQGAARNPATT